MGFSGEGPALAPGILLRQSTQALLVARDRAFVDDLAASDQHADRPSRDECCIGEDCHPATERTSDHKAVMVEIGQRQN